jgi:protein SCO1/2
VTARRPICLIAAGLSILGAVYAVGPATRGALRAEATVPSQSLPYFRTRELTPEWLDNATVSAASMHGVGSFALRDQHGVVVTDSVLDGHVTIVHFFFAECGGVCPMTQANLTRLLGAVTAGELQILSHSVQPERDTVQALAAYASRYGIEDRRWRLLTGPRTMIDALAGDSYFVNLRDGRSYGTTSLAHTETLVLVDGGRRIRGVYDGTLRLEMDRLAEDIGALRREGSGR